MLAWAVLLETGSHFEVRPFADNLRQFVKTKSMPIEHMSAFAHICTPDDDCLYFSDHIPRERVELSERRGF